MQLWKWHKEPAFLFGKGSRQGPKWGEPKLGPSLLLLLLLLSHSRAPKAPELSPSYQSPLLFLSGKRRHSAWPGFHRGVLDLRLLEIIFQIFHHITNDLCTKMETKMALLCIKTPEWDHTWEFWVGQKKNSSSSDVQGWLFFLRSCFCL